MPARSATDDAMSQLGNGPVQRDDARRLEPQQPTFARRDADSILRPPSAKRRCYVRPE
jgi:hypothetical protein